MCSPALLYSSFAAAVLIATLSPAHAQTSPDAGQIVHGNAMRPFGGIDLEDERQKIIGYLKSAGEN
jgi:hypothetical protein